MNIRSHWKLSINCIVWSVFEIFYCKRVSCLEMTYSNTVSECTHSRTSIPRSTLIWSTKHLKNNSIIKVKLPFLFPKYIWLIANLLDHWIEMLRQRLTCSPDLSIITSHWRESQDLSDVEPATNHVCVDWPKSMVERRIILRSPPIRKPEGLCDGGLITFQYYIIVCRWYNYSKIWFCLEDLKKYVAYTLKSQWTFPVSEYGREFDRIFTIEFISVRWAN